MRHSVIFLAFGFLALGCSRKKEVLSPQEASGEGKVVLKVTYVRPGGLAKPALALVDRMTAYVYEPDNTEITHKDLERIGNVGRATITLTL